MWFPRTRWKTWLLMQEQPLSGKECGKDFSKNWALIRHQQIHAEEALWMQECGKASHSMADFIRHVWGFILGKSHTSVSSVGRPSNAGLTLTEHQRIHSGDKPMSAKNVGKAFTHRFLSSSIMWLTLEKSPFCARNVGKPFTTAPLLNTWGFTLERNSMSAANVERPSLTGPLLSSIIWPTREKNPFVQRMWKSFLPQLILHSTYEDSHWEKPYECSECGKAFTHRST